MASDPTLSHGCRIRGHGGVWVCVAPQGSVSQELEAGVAAGVVV